MKKFVIIICMSLSVFALQAQNVDSLTMILERKYAEYEKIVTEVENFHCNLCTTESANKWLISEFILIKKMEEEIMKMEKEFKEIIDKNNPLQLKK